MVTVLLLFSVAFFVGSFTFNHYARALPELISAITTVILIVYLATTNSRSGFRVRSASDAIARKPALNAVADEHRGDEPAEQVAQTAIGSGKGGLLLPVIYLAMFVVLGLLPAVFLAIAGYSWWFGKTKWYRAVAIGVAVDVVIYVLFLTVLKFPLYDGLLFNWM
jgi:hypothetical protein